MKKEKSNLQKSTLPISFYSLTEIKNPHANLFLNKSAMYKTSYFRITKASSPISKLM